MLIRLLTESDIQAFVEMRRRALIDAPLAFGASPDDDFAATAEAVRASLARAPEWVIAGAFDEALRGAVGLFRDRHRKAAHKAHLWGMYVEPQWRGRGIGRALLDAAVAHARTLEGVTTIRLSVSSAATAAQRLYESAGFETWGIEPDAMLHDGTVVGQAHMALWL
jgi:ribosomal protein S18 acetylase RimI-like enzyme